MKAAVGVIGLLVAVVARGGCSTVVTYEWFEAIMRFMIAIR
jgi:hypothetical protein